MRKERLKPLLIQYSSDDHRQGFRDYFEGQYKFDYGLTPENKNSKDIYILYHDRCKTENIEKQKQRLTSSRNFSIQIKPNKYLKLRDNVHSTSHKQRDRDFSAGLSHRKITLNPDQIRLPSISKSKNECNPQEGVKKHFYHCGNQQCPAKYNQPEKKQVGNIKKWNLSKKKGKIIKIPPQPIVRKRYTPTYVCSRDNPLPCFKIYQTL